MFPISPVGSHPAAKHANQSGDLKFTPSFSVSTGLLQICLGQNLTKRWEGGCQWGGQRQSSNPPERVVNFSVYAIITSANEASGVVLTRPLRSTKHMWRRVTNAD